MTISKEGVSNQVALKKKIVKDEKPISQIMQDSDYFKPTV